LLKLLFSMRPRWKRWCRVCFRNRGKLMQP